MCVGEEGCKQAREEWDWGTRSGMCVGGFFFFFFFFFPEAPRDT